MPAVERNFFWGASHVTKSKVFLQKYSKESCLNITINAKGGRKFEDFDISILPSPLPEVIVLAGEDNSIIDGQISVSNYIKMVNEIIDKLSSMGIKVLLVASLGRTHQPPKYGSLQKYKTIRRAIERKKNKFKVPRCRFSKQINNSMGHDGVHLTKYGYKEYSKNIVNFINKIIN